MDDQIIDLGEYARKKEAEEDPVHTTFQVWGGDGDRSRFALPLWRAAYLAGGTRASLCWEYLGSTREELEPLIVLDLAAETARLSFSGDMVEGLRRHSAAPVLEKGDDVLAIYLGERDGRRWYLIVDDLRERAGADRGQDQQDLYFLAGECAGLLFHRDLDVEADIPGSPTPPPGRTTDPPEDLPPSSV